MAHCDVCENFDWEHIDGDPEILACMTNEGKRNFQPDLYYYWDGDFCSEDYYWRDAFPDVDCMCEICFDIANEEKKIKWVDDKNPFECAS